MINLILFGKPGSGKGTQAEFIKKKYDLIHISTGDVFRYNISKQTDLGLLAKSYMEKGDLVPDNVTIQMLEAEVNKTPNAKGFIFDGFPRTTLQAEMLDEFLNSKNLSISMIIALEVDENILIDRLINRGKASGRADDQDRSKIQNRFEEYNTKTSTLINYYKSQNKFFEIEGIGEIDEISQRLFNVIDLIIK
ncbi:MAG: adenylate kinase [Flavobacteriaceae bacterium]|jgi:adenylate kinase|nr:adenylate kinase [Flavobacteriaceae bacterium]MBT4415096.1 adenylate kinase [Flavobacteriaceae bacterium]MBT5012502.1 adenylate kinase [Flavobacteriaceae bacterium]MBT6688337.1 adenylate kinase [Flavobacteriaceae bacterium]MBT7319805.1 adenylate kinase [Flavobacteriaceae bacterium]|tara:strand:+ start:5311 stop:5889 length:579 start_codon:yes stop_codon:yes gene_type:complete